jgi:hypothetical protein
MHSKHMRHVGGAQPSRTLTCCDGWSLRYSSVNRPYARTTRATRTTDPNPWGLTRHELTDEIARCRADGWQAWELRQVFGRWAA